MAKEKIQSDLEFDQNLLANLLKDNKADHYNFLAEKYYKVSTASFLLDHATIGGLMPGLHRFTGPSECGKTHAALDVMSGFLALHKEGKGIYIEAEGRLSKEAQSQYGIKFVYDAKDWVDGTCFVFQTNVYELVAEFIEKVVRGGGRNLYCIVLDSVDGLAPRDAFLKKYEESAKVAGGAVISANLMKRIAIPLGKFGHMAIFLSQERAEIKLDPYSKKEFRLFNGSGGNALMHYANFIFNFEPRYKSDLIMTDDKSLPSISNPILGHYAKITIKKSPNERSNILVKYPVKYGRKRGSSVWIEKEIVDMLMMWQEIKKGGAWYEFSDEVYAALIEEGCEIGQKHQGMARLYTAIEESPCAIETLKTYIQEKLLAEGVDEEEEEQEETSVEDSGGE